MHLLKDETYSQQSKLASYCRTGETPDGLLGINKDNLYQYRRLVYNIASDILETAYPITFSYLEKDVWDELVKDYFSNHKCQTAQVWRMPLEFYEYCKTNDIGSRLNIPFLNDLLLFEWLELEVHTMEDQPYPSFTSEGNWLYNRIAINPEYKLIPLEYPVHTTPPSTELLEKKGNYFLLIYREKETGNVQFIDLSVLYTYLLENIANGSLLEDVLKEADTVFQLDNLELLKERALDFIEDLRERKFILGFLTE